MIGRLESVGTALWVRRCVACGYDGALLREGEATHCARCGCDLVERPARSYAEMEGFASDLAGPELRDTLAPAQESSERGSLLQRWLAFAFVVLLGIFTAVTLLTNGLP